MRVGTELSTTTVGAATRGITTLSCRVSTGVRLGNAESRRQSDDLCVCLDTHACSGKHTMRNTAAKVTTYACADVHEHAARTNYAQDGRQIVVKRPQTGNNGDTSTTHRLEEAHPSSSY